MQFLINDMTCSHCVGAVTKAVQAVDAAADVRIDLAARIATVASSAETARIADAIRDAGYTPQPV
ncbi:MAG TPA: heavy-metal-associated domain-containing protein [Herbaspirillum sp.]|jgi:copper chaperone